MPKIAYRTGHKFNTASRKLIARSNEIIDDYTSQGLILTIRQLYYVLVTENVIANKERSYKNLIATMTLARLAGLVDWLAFEDRTRGLRDFPSWDTEDEIIRGAAQQFRRDKWKTQKHRPEVWVEKQALEGVISSICSDIEVPFFTCRGYNSSSEMWNGAQRLARHIRDGKTPIVYYLGDHDPSGIHMPKDIADRVHEFIMLDKVINRIALNMSQVRQMKLPPNPAKKTDSRYRAYASKFGDDSYELDAMNPKTLRDLIMGHVAKIRDEKAWKIEVDIEIEAKAHLAKIADNYGKVRKYVDRLKS